MNRQETKLRKENGLSGSVVTKWGVKASFWEPGIWRRPAPYKPMSLCPKVLQVHLGKESNDRNGRELANLPRALAVSDT